MNFNVSTMVGLYKAIKYNMPVIKRFVTITGDGIKKPMNFRVRVGTSVKDLLEPYCGGYVHPEKDKVFIIGGPMMGNSVPSDDIILTKTVTSVIVLDKEDNVEQPCVRCGSCVLSCPVHLEPVQIMNAVKAMDKERIKMLNPLRCIECGLCAYSCTSKIQVTDYIRRAKIFAKL
jgi:electron transport complex protein RnfC